MDKGKKQVIPRSQYRRKRREFFHNEEREARIQQEQQEKLKQAKKEAQQSKVNEERVKDNLRKARIEKLTQEEIHQQHSQDIKENTPDTSIQDNNHIKQQVGKETNSIDDEKNTVEHHAKKTDEEIKQQNAIDRADNYQNDEPIQQKTSETKEKPKETELQNDSKDNKEQQRDTLEKQESRPKKTKKKRNSKFNQLTTKKANQEEPPLYTHQQIKKENTQRKNDTETVNSKDEQKQQAANITSAKKNHKQTHQEKSKKTQTEPNKATKENKQDNINNAQILESITKFFKKHWVKVVIVVAVIILILLLSAIFRNVNNTGTNQSGLLNSGNHDKKYTATMKSANSAVKSVVTVESESPKNSTLPKDTKDSESEIGSGVVYKKVDGAIYIMTNAHVVGNEKKQKLTYGNNQTIQGKVVGKDKWSDIAVIKAEAPKDDALTPIDIGDSSNLILGQSILVVGNPLGVDFKGSVSKGIISGMNRFVPADLDKDGKYDVLSKAFQVDAPVNPGNSGGAVVDENGDLIGIASLKINMDNVEGMAFAIPINDAQKIAKQLEDKGKVVYPNTGIDLQNVGDLNDTERKAIKLPDKVKNGVVIKQIDTDSLGEKSGLKTDDVIVELDGKLIEDNLRYRQIIFSHREDLKTITAKIYRDGELKEVKIKLK